MRLLASTALLTVVALTGCKQSMHPYSLSSSSMYPTIRPGDHFFVDQSPAARTNLHDGDIIAFHREEGTIVLKRILAMPGETISGTDRKIFRNGKPVNEPYLAAPVSGEDAVLPSFPQRKVPPGQLFVLGDNRDHSFDSRAPEYAPVAMSDVVGKYSWTYWQSRSAAK